MGHKPRVQPTKQGQRLPVKSSGCVRSDPFAEGFARLGAFGAPGRRLMFERQYDNRGVGPVHMGGPTLWWSTD